MAATDVRRRLLLGIVLGALAGAAGVALTATAGWLIVRSAEHPPVLLLIGAIVGVRTFGLARPVLRYVERLVSHDAVLRLLAEQRAAVYDRLVPLVPGRLGPHRGDVLSSVVDDVDTALDGHLRVRAPLVSGSLVVAGTTAFAALVAPAAAAPVAVAALVGGGAALLLSWLSARRAERAFVAARGLLSARVAAVLDGAADLGAWQAGDRAAAAVVAAGSTLARAARGAAAGAATGRAVAVVAAGAGVVAVLEAGAPAYAAGALSGPMLALLALLPLALLDVLLPLADVGPLAVRVRAARLRLDALAGLEPAVTDPADARAAGPGSDVRLGAVDAGWGDTPALTGVDLDLPEGARVGVVGPSGSGKSTLAALMLRFLDPDAGNVTLDGAPLERLALADVRRTVGLVDDDPHVFASTLRENLRLARPGATDAEILAALDRARLTPWVAGLPAGLDTFLGEGHTGVSGGERARIAVARAVLGARRVLVLDEPTAHLDTATAQSLTDDLLGRDDGRSVLWITHGRVGLDRMDRVLDLGEQDRTGQTCPNGANFDESTCTAARTGTIAAWSTAQQPG